MYSLAFEHNDPLWSHTYQLKRSPYTRTLTHCVHRANKPSRCSRCPLRQTNVVVPDTVTFAVEPENGASLERPKAMYYNLLLLLVFCGFWNTSETGAFSLMRVTKKRLAHLLFPVTVFTLRSFQATRFLTIPTLSFRGRLSRDLSTLPLYLARAKWFPRILGNRVNLKNSMELLRILEKAWEIIKFPEIRGNSQNFFKACLLEFYTFSRIPLFQYYNYEGSKA